MARHRCGIIGLLATVASGLTSGAVLANPEAGNAFSQTIQPVTISSLNANIPTILRTVGIKCPAAGSLIVNADASFSISFNAGATFGTLHYAVSRTTTYDNADDHVISVPNTGFNPTIPAGAQRFDSCTAGQTITYRFVAFLFGGLTAATSAIQPRLSVIFVRDRD
jgi:hypothetical protein